MRTPRFFTAGSSRPRGRIVALDLLVILILCVLMVAISAHAPSHTYCYAQFWQIQVSIDQANGGSMLLAKVDNRRDEDDNYTNYARKPQLYAWILTGLMKITGRHDDFIFRAPTIISFIAMAALVYLLGIRWYSRAAGLAASCLLVTCLHMGKFAFLATTDMLLVFLITACIFCADRLTFHRCASRHRVWWLLAFWISMILAALTKGWGIVNLVIVCGFLAMAGAFAAGFAVCRKIDNSRRIHVIQVILKRWWAIICDIQLIPGIVLLAAILIPLWIAMLQIGGDAFRARMYFEIVQRITGEGSHPPHSASGPMLAHLYYNLLPMSIFGGCALFMIKQRKSSSANDDISPGFFARIGNRFRSWLNYRSPISLPFWWIITVMIAFGVPAGFRPDYLLPCYPAAALVAGWVVVEISRPENWSTGQRHLRRICQFVPVVPAAACVLIPLAYFIGYGSWNWLPHTARILSSTWYILAILPGIGVVSMIAAYVGIRRRMMTLTIGGTCVAMIGLLFCYTHLFSRQARHGDGDTMVLFSRQAGPQVGDDPFVVCMGANTGFQAYHGRLGRIASWPGTEDLEDGNEKWLVTTDRGLLALGAYEEADGANGLGGDYSLKVNNARRRFIMHPDDLGTVRSVSSVPLAFEDWGRIYLIELQKPYKLTSPPLDVGYISDEAR